MGCSHSTVPTSPGSTTRLCEVCSKLDIPRLEHSLHPCRNPLPCSTPPIKQFGTYLALGSVDEIKSRRLGCDVCNLVAEHLDKEPADLDGQCRITESAQYCTFKLPSDVQVRDPGITHFHLTQASVIFDTVMADQFQGPSLPWELKARDTHSTHYLLDLQVKAQSEVETRGSTFLIKTEEEFLDAMGGRYVGAQVNAKLIRSWLQQCESEHGRDCVPSVRLPSDLDRDPTFMIDVHRSCLVKTPAKCRYVALSYVWGRASVFKHVTANTQDLIKTGSLRSLPIPATIRDAFILVNAIGERYLWVDSLCIIQDDLKMQQVEIKLMTAIYSKALFTIIAAAGDNADSGLPGVRSQSREHVQKILKLANHELLTVIDIRRTPVGIDETVWAQRAWTFQERILSNRMLVFSQKQVYWSCRAASHSEERTLEHVREINRLQLAFPQRPRADWLSWEPLQSSEYCDLYNDLLSMYRQRRLTYQTDQLNAFSGVSQILAALQGDLFLWGLPESLFSFALSWFFTGYSVRNNAETPIFASNGSKQMVPFPSWSWAAWSGDDPDNPPFLQAADLTRGQPVTRFYIVDFEYKLVRIKERELENPPNNDFRAKWQNEQPHSAPSLLQYPVPKIGQLYFWTSFANVRSIRSRAFVGQNQLQYTLFASPDLPSTPGKEIVDQDFIVVAARTIDRLVLLAIEWKEGVAYRVGDAEVLEAAWAHVENREWRLIILG